MAYPIQADDGKYYMYDETNGLDMSKPVNPDGTTIGGAVPANSWELWLQQNGLPLTTPPTPELQTAYQSGSAPAVAQNSWQKWLQSQGMPLDTAPTPELQTAYQSAGATSTTYKYTAGTNGTGLGGLASEWTNEATGENMPAGFQPAATDKTLYPLPNGTYAEQNSPEYQAAQTAYVDSQSLWGDIGPGIMNSLAFYGAISGGNSLLDAFSGATLAPTAGTELLGADGGMFGLPTDASAGGISAGTVGTAPAYVPDLSQYTQAPPPVVEAPPPYVPDASQYTQAPPPPVVEAPPVVQPPPVVEAPPVVQPPAEEVIPRVTVEGTVPPIIPPIVPDGLIPPIIPIIPPTGDVPPPSGEPPPPPPPSGDPNTHPDEENVDDGWTTEQKSLWDSIKGILPAGLVSALAKMPWASVAGLLGGGLLGAFGGGAKPAGTTTTVQDLPDWLKTYVTGNLDAAKAWMTANPLDMSGATLAANQMKSTISGDYLNNNPYVDAMFNQAAGQVGAGVDSRFSGLGRYGSGAHQGVLGTSFNKLATDIYGGNYANERKNQVNASAAMPGFIADTYNAGFSPFAAFGNLTKQNVSSTTSPYFTNPTNDVLGGALAGYTVARG